MSGPGRSPGRAVAASERVYRVLMRAYPEEVRAGYGQEMARCFRDLCRREVRRRGVVGLVLLWARTLPELVLTALKERGVVIAGGSSILTPAPAAAARFGGGAAVSGGAIGVAYYLLAWAVISDPPFSVIIKPPFDHFGLLVEPLYTTGFFASPLRYASMYSMGHPFITTGFFAAQLLCVLGLLGLYGATTTRVHRGAGHGLALAGGALGSMSAALWLAVGGYQLTMQLLPRLWLVIGGYDTVSGALTVGGTFCWVSGLTLLGIAAWRARLPWRLRGLPLVAAASLLTSIAALSMLDYAPHFGLVGYGAGKGWLRAVSMLAAMLPFLGSLFVGLVLLRHEGDARARGSTAVVAGTPENRGRASARATRTFSRSRPTTDAPAAEGEKEKEVLEALRRHGELTVAGAALGTSLTVEEADRMLSALAAKGHLEVRAERGRLLYSLWEGDAPGA